MKLFERKCPQCGHNEFWFNNDDNEPQPLCIRDPYDDITFYVICMKCKCEFSVDCIPTWVINGEY